jgi:hypothetical protein
MSTDGSWIPVYQSVRDHVKTMALADALDIEPVQALGHVVSLWLWAIDNDTIGASARSLARGAQYTGDAVLFRSALVAAGFLDDDGAIHNWDDYVGKLLEQRALRRASNRKAQAARRERLRQESELVSADVSADKADSQHPTGPNRTGPNQTEHPSLRSGGARAHARENSPPQEGVTNEPERYDEFKTLVLEHGIDHVNGLPSQTRKAVNECDIPVALLAEGYAMRVAEWWQPPDGTLAARELSPFAVIADFGDYEAQRDRILAAREDAEAEYDPPSRNDRGWFGECRRGHQMHPSNTLPQPNGQVRCLKCQSPPERPPAAPRRNGQWNHV